MRVNLLISRSLLSALLITLVAALSQAQTATQLAPTAASAFPVGLGAAGVATNGARVLVANQFSNTVTMLRASDGTAVGTYAVGHRPVALAFDGAFFWVANYLSDNV